jgi:molybdate transport system permease protein
VEHGPLLLSFEVASIATVVVAVAGVGAAALLANFRFPGRDVLDVLFTAPLVMPPTVLGYYMLVSLGARSTIGAAFEKLTGTAIVFTKTGIVGAAAIGALPLVVKNVRASLEDTDPTLMLAARTLGAPPLRAVFTVQLPLAARGVVAALMLAFARSLGDFGLTYMVGGDRPGETRTAALAIYDALEGRREHEAMVMSIVLTVVVLGLLYVVGKLTAKRPEAR